MFTAAAIGTVFEKQVAEQLLRLGFEVWRDLYVPTEKGHAQVDIVAIRPGQFWVFECKNWAGTLDLSTWVRTTETSQRREADFFRQNEWHAIALHKHINVPWVTCTVVNNSLHYTGSPAGRICKLRDLDGVVDTVTSKFSMSEKELMQARVLCTMWNSADEETRRKHRLRLQDKYNPPEVLVLP